MSRAVLSSLLVAALAACSSPPPPPLVTHIPQPPDPLMPHDLVEPGRAIVAEPDERHLALVFSTQEIAEEALLRRRGWEVRHVRMPCHNDLECWANEPGLFAQFRAQVKASLSGRRDVLLLGVSRGGYLALGMADLPEVSRVIALAPMTEPGRPSVFSGPFATPLNANLIAGKPTFLQVSSTDDTVDTLATLRYASAAMNAALTVSVDASVEGHTTSDPSMMLAWLAKVQP